MALGECREMVRLDPTCHNLVNPGEYLRSQRKGETQTNERKLLSVFQEYM